MHHSLVQVMRASACTYLWCHVHMLDLEISKETMTIAVAGS